MKLSGRANPATSILASAHFSPDGKRVVTVSAEGVAGVWDIAPSGTGFPDWLFPLTEAFAGRRLNLQGVLETTGQDPDTVIGGLRQQLDQATGNDDWVVWGRWFLADPTTRTISPYSSMTVPQYIEDRIKENNEVSLAEAGHVALGNSELSARVAKRLRVFPAQE